MVQIRRWGKEDGSSEGEKTSQLADATIDTPEHKSVQAATGQRIRKHA
jgi:hypothetical protein